MQIDELNKGNEVLYEKFLLQDKSALFYYASKYKNLLEQFLKCETKYYLAIDEEGQVKGVLPLAFKKGPLGKVINSLPFYGSNAGILATNETAQKKLSDLYNELASAGDVASITYIENPLSEKNRNEIKHNILDYRIGQFTSLDFSGDVASQLMESFHFKTRNVVRKAIKENFKIETDNNAWGFLTEIHKENMEAIGGKAKPDEFFECIRKTYKAGSDYRIYVAKTQNDEPAAAMLVFLYNNIVEYYTPVIKAEFRPRQPLSHIIYHAMAGLATEGYKLWNWGGTWKTQDGVYRFKSRWNARDLNYNYYTQINNPEIYNSTPQYLLEHYPYFFVLPFDKLISSSANA